MPARPIEYCKLDPEMDWYGKVKAAASPKDVILSQGDIIRRCPRYVPIRRVSSRRILTQAVYYNVIILSQSCDLAKDEVDQAYRINDVVVCPVTALNKHIEANIFTYVPTKIKPDKKEL